MDLEKRLERIERKIDELNDNVSSVKTAFESNTARNDEKFKTINKRLSMLSTWQEQDDNEKEQELISKLHDLHNHSRKKRWFIIAAIVTLLTNIGSMLMINKCSSQKQQTTTIKK